VVVLTRPGPDAADRPIVALGRRVAVFFRADLRGSRFERADLSGMQFRAVDLSGARFRGGNLSGTVMRGAELAGVDIYGEIENVTINALEARR
jgi:uncharacterized protein YjbI with pentapeptide repeats